MPITDYLNTSNYVSAKALFDEESRTWSGRLPKLTTWSLREDDTNGWKTGTVTAADKHRAVFDSGFYVVHFPDSAPQSMANTTVTGYSHMPDYVRQTGIPYIIRAGVGNRTHDNTLTLSEGLNFHPCFNTSGDHIGTETTGVTDPCGIGVENHTYSKQYRFFTAVDTPQNPMTDLGQYWAIPIIPESEGFWSSCDDYIYNNNSTYGLGIITTLQGTFSVTASPVGFVEDFEDFDMLWRITSTTHNLYGADPRFAFTTRVNKSSDKYAHESLSSMIDARIEVLDGNLPNVQTDYSVMYELNPTTAKYASYSNRLSKFSDGRKKGNLTGYAFQFLSSIFSDPTEVLLFASRGVAEFASFDVHCFHTFLASTSRFPASGGTYPDVAGTPGSNEGILTVAQMVGWSKIFMAMGSRQLINYNSDSGSQDFWCMAVAYDEMQEYYDYIKEGYNFVPPAAINRKWKTGAGNLFSFIPTCFYDKDYDGNSIDSTIFICCRIKGNKMMFCGLVLNTTGNATTTHIVDIRSPSNERVSITCTPYGTITIL